jgi:predicted metal-binding membrane protein
MIAARPTGVGFRFRALDPSAVRGPRATLGFELVIAASWVATIWMSAASGSHPGAAGGQGAMSMSMSSMPGMSLLSMPGMSAGTHTSVQHAVLMGLPMWLAMSAAMMLPGVLPAVGHVATNSFRWRRGRAMTGFVIVYLAVWGLFGAAVLGVLSVFGLQTSVALAVALTLAAGWQLTSSKRRALRDCHRSVPLPPSGWPAAREVGRFGLRHGTACLRSCWPLMLVMAVVPVGEMVLWMPALTLLVSAEKLASRPRRVVKAGSALLGAAALATLLVALG